MLRVAIACGGRVLDERLVKKHQDVTIGVEDECTFAAVVAERRSFALFEYRHGAWHLHVLDNMAGAVDSGAGVEDLAALRTAASRNLDGSWSIRLGDKARGKVLVGRSVFLFQMVDPPAHVATPQLPVSVLNRRHIDWPFTIIGALSFAAHYAVLGVMTSDWAETKIDDATYIAGVVDAVNALPAVPPPPDEKLYESSSDEGLATKPQPGAPAAEARTNGGVAGGPRARPGGMTQGERDAALRELDGIDLGISGALGSNAPATERVLRSSEHPSGDLDAIARSGAGSGRPGESGLNFGGSSSRVTPGVEHGFMLPGGTPSGTAAASATESRPPPPPPVATVQAQPQATCTIPNVQGTVARLRPMFRQCYMRHGLSVNPEMEGGVQVTAMVGPNGEVQAVQASASGTISAAVSACVASHVRGAQFEQPACGTATVIIPVWLKHQ